MDYEAGGFKVTRPGWFRSGKILREMKDLDRYPRGFPVFSHRRPLP